MFRTIQDQLQRRADLLLAGREADLSRDYLFPMAVYLEDHLISLQSAEEAVDMLRALRMTLRPLVLSALTITVKAVEVPRKGRFRVWATWRGVSEAPACVAQTDVVYYMRETPLGYRTEMLHYLRVGSCALRSYVPAQRRSA